MTDPNKRQVGGKHYSSTYQHWNLIYMVGMDYYSGNATKYVSRWRLKGGVEDLKKALHYVEKLSSVAREVAPLRGSHHFSEEWIKAEVSRFCQVNKLFPTESHIIEYLAIWSTYNDLEVAKAMISDLIEEVEPVPLTEETHYGDRANAGG